MVLHRNLVYWLRVHASLLVIISLHFSNTYIGMINLLYLGGRRRYVKYLPNVLTDSCLNQ